MGHMQSYSNNETYDVKVLTIPDLVLPSDIPYIIHFFDYYSIANVKDVDIRQHPEEEYYVEDKQFYGYAVIEIREWYKNNTSLSFYENLISGSAKIVYDDPHFWNVEFYQPRTQEEERNSSPNSPIDYHPNNNVNVTSDSSQNTIHNMGLVIDKKHHDHYSHDTYDESDGSYDSYNTNDNNSVESKNADDEKDDEKDDAKDDEKDDEKDDAKDDAYEFVESYEDEDSNYEFLESDEDEDSNYEYLFYNRNKMNTKTKKNNRENKSKATDENTENVTLVQLIIKKNKNYIKRDKRKPYKNVWSRRLREKLEA